MKPRALHGLKVLRAALQQQRQEAEHAERVAQQHRQMEALQQAASQQEADLFARSVGAVIPLRTAARADVHAPKPAAVPRQRWADERSVLRESLSHGVDADTLMETDDSLSYRRSWVGPDVLRKLRRGVWVVQGHIDLHGLRREEAREALNTFLAAASQRGWRCVRVVHGKGHGSPGRQPVLKDKVRHWLALRAAVIAYAQARAPDGGAGALIVLLDAPSVDPPPRRVARSGNR